MHAVAMIRRPLTPLFISESNITGGRQGNLMDRRCKYIPVTVVLPDCAAYFLQMGESSKGIDCLTKICSILGIVEEDYFGLKYHDKAAGCWAWINNRLNLKRQLKNCKKPFSLSFRVKYYTDPRLLQQPSTKRAFFKEIKQQIMTGYLKIPSNLQPQIGALTAQVDMGDCQEYSSRFISFTYQEYFPDWSSGIAFKIFREHRKLKGMSKESAIESYLVKVCDLNLCGMFYYPGTMDGQEVIVAVGSRNVLVLDSRQTNLVRIPYYSMTQVCFGNTFFGVHYHFRDEDGRVIDKKLRVIVSNNHLARHIFRATTEQQVFFYQSSVLSEVLNHADHRSRRFQRVFRKFCCGDAVEIDYYFDILRTKHETYSYMWQQLHQVQSGSDHRTEEEGESVEMGEEYDPAYATVTVESDDSSSLIDSEPNKLYWGLSASSCNIAKDLLAEPQLQSDDSDSALIPLLHLSPKAVASRQKKGTSTSAIPAKSSGQLSPAQSDKLRQLLCKIHEDRLCQICMMAKLSAVFCPCGHHVACYQCARKLHSCPICRKPVGYVQYVYIR